MTAFTRLRRSVALSAGVLLVTAPIPVFGQGNLDIQIDPQDPLDTSPVTVTVAAWFFDACFFVCDVNGKWIGPQEFHIDWYIRDEHGHLGCALIPTLRSSQLALALLEAGEYSVTGTMYITPWDGECTEGALDTETKADFDVRFSIPTVSAWGLGIMGLLLLATGTVLLRRRSRPIVCCLLPAGQRLKADG